MTVKTKKYPHPYVPGSHTIRPYIVGYGCDGSTGANIHYCIYRLCGILGWNYNEIYLKAYEWQDRDAELLRKMKEYDPENNIDEATKKPVKECTIIPKDTRIKDLLEDLYDINNRSFVEELETRLESHGIDINTHLVDLEKTN